MTISTANGLTILSCALQVPRVGAWHAEVSVEAEEADAEELEGEITLELVGATWTGFARRSGAHHGRVELLVVGGAGGLSTVLEPRYYADATTRVPLGDICREAGETLSSTVSADVTGTLLARWTRTRGSAGRALADLVSALGVASWRVLPDGSIWLGDEEWPDAELEHDVIDEDPAHATMVLAVDELTLAPGTVFEGRGVSRLHHTIGADGAVRTGVWFETSGAAGAP